MPQTQIDPWAVVKSEPIPAGDPWAVVPTGPLNAAGKKAAKTEDYYKPEHINQLDEAWQAAKDLIKGTAKVTGDVATATFGQPQALIEDLKGVVASHKEQFDKAVTAAKEGRASEAYGHGLAAALPGIGPVAASIGEDAGTGHYGRAAVNAAAIAAPEVAKIPAVQTTAKGVAATLDNSWKAVQANRASTRVAKIAEQAHSDITKAIPASKTTPYKPEDVKRAAPYLAAEHTTSPITTVDGLREAADSAITQVEAHVETYIDAHKTDLIPTNPLREAKQILSAGARSTDVVQGLKELDDLGLDGPITLEQADHIRLRLNAENANALKKNNYSVANAMKADPKFAARQAAASALRRGIYEQLENRGIPGVAELRLDEGALIKLRNAAQDRVYQAGNDVPGTGTDSLARRIAAKSVTIGGTAAGGAIGGAMGGVPGAIGGAAAGGVLGGEVASSIAKSALSRDALVERAFSKFTTPAPTYPTIPPPPQIRGLLPAPQTPQGLQHMGGQWQAVPPQPGPAPLGINTLPPRTTPYPRLPEKGSFQRVESYPQGPGSPTSYGEQTTDASKTEAIPARPVLAQDPVTGRYKRVFTAQPESAGQMTPEQTTAFRQQVADVASKIPQKELKLSPELWREDPLQHIVNVPWDVAQDGESMHNTVRPMLAEGKFRIGTVKPNKNWIATQTKIDSRDVPPRAFTAEAAQKAFKLGGANTPPTIVRSGGKTFIVEGHHRFSTAMKTGDYVRAVIVDLDKEQ